MTNCKSSISQCHQHDCSQIWNSIDSFDTDLFKGPETRSDCFLLEFENNRFYSRKFQNVAFWLADIFYIKWWNINLEVLSRSSFSTFGSLKNLKKSFQIYFYSNQYFLSDELFCKFHFYIWIDQWDQISHEIYPPVDRESDSDSFNTAHATHASSRLPWNKDKIRKSPDGTGTIRIWLGRNLRLYWTKERWSWKEIGTLLKRINPSILIYFMSHNFWVTWLTGNSQLGKINYNLETSLWALKLH